MALRNFLFLKILLNCSVTASTLPEGLLAFFANGANPQQDINVVATAIQPLILPIKKYSLFADPSEPNTTPATVSYTHLRAHET